MQLLNDVIRNPSGWDSLDNYMGETEFGPMFVVLTRNRDSDVLTNCNWDVALKELGGESDDVVIHHFGHWACGWWEALCVREGSEAYKTAEAIHTKLENYLVLDEMAFSDAEQEEADTIWKSCYTWQKRIQYIRNHASQFEPRDFADLLHCVRGEYFIGYTCELID